MMVSRTVTMLVVGMASMVAGVVVLTVPYMGYPWLRHSVFLQILGVCGLVVGLFISLYCLSNSWRARKDGWVEKGGPSKALNYPQYHGKETFAGPPHSPIQIYTLNEKEVQKLPDIQPYKTSEDSDNKKEPPARLPRRKKPKTEKLKSMTNLHKSSNIFTKTSQPNFLSNKNSKRKNNENVAIERPSKKTFFRKTPGSEQRKKVHLKNVKHSRSRGTFGIKGAFSSLRKQTDKEPKDPQKGHENLAGPQYEDGEEVILKFKPGGEKDQQILYKEEDPQCKPSEKTKYKPVGNNNNYGEDIQKDAFTATTLLSETSDLGKGIVKHEQLEVEQTKRSKGSTKNVPDIILEEKTNTDKKGEIFCVYY